VKIPVEPDGYFHVYNQYVVRVPKRDALRAFLGSRGIGTAVYYPVPFHDQECFRYLNYASGAFPHAEAAALETLALPVFPELTEDQQKHVVQSIAEFLL
jgi:dTDP-4-amino-4,6-dideoxygalactose transaminase